MAVPTSYTEDEFKAYLHLELGKVAGALGWEIAGGQYNEPVNDALYAIGASVVTGVAADDIAGFRTLGKLMTWRKVLSHVSADYDFSDVKASQKRSQVHDMAIDMIAQLEKNAADDGVGANATQTVTVGTVIHTENPYGVNEDD